MKAALIGSPVSLSLSPMIFNYISCEENCPLDYSAQDVEPSELTSYLNQLRLNKEYLGVNVTIPHKESVMQDLDQFSEEAAAIGAVNLIYRNAGSLMGFNTDVTGIKKTLINQEFVVDGKNCIILGAGGAAKAMAFVLGKLKANNVYIYNPRSNRGEELVKKYNIIFPETKFVSIHHFDDCKSKSISLIVNSTPIGMKNFSSNSQIENDFFNEVEKITFEKNALAYDLIYNPKNTAFIKKLKQLGLQTVGGLGMLVDQALASWEILYKPLKDIKKIHNDLINILSGILYLRENSEPLYLTGFMGVGKTTIAKELALMTGRTFIDTDHLVEKSTGMTISQIFKDQGELKFRESETAAVLQASTIKNSIISLGGGALVNQNNLETVLKNGTLIYLSADENSLAKRLSKTTRPLFLGLNHEETKVKVNELLQQRKKNYMKANIEIQVLNVLPFETACKVIAKIGTLKG